MPLTILHATCFARRTATTGCPALFVARPTARLAAMAALRCGLAVAVRPAGLLLLAIWPILLWLLGRRCAGRRWRLAAAVADRHFFAKALMMDAEPTVRDPEVADVLSDAWRATAAFRKAVADAPDWQSRTVLLMRAEQDAGRGKYTRPFRHRLSELARPTGRHRSFSAAREVVFARPREWMANAAVHYVGLWTHYTIHDEAFSRRWAAWTEGLDGGAPVVEDCQAIALGGRSRGGLRFRTGWRPWRRSWPP